VPVETDTLANLEGRRELKSDYIHLNTQGYQLLAEAIAALLTQQGT